MKIEFVLRRNIPRMLFILSDIKIFKYLKERDKKTKLILLMNCFISEW